MQFAVLPLRQCPAAMHPPASTRPRNQPLPVRGMVARTMRGGRVESLSPLAATPASRPGPVLPSRNSRASRALCRFVSTGRCLCEQREGGVRHAVVGKKPRKTIPEATTEHAQSQCRAPGNSSNPTRSGHGRSPAPSLAGPRASIPSPTWRHTHLVLLHRHGAVVARHRCPRPPRRQPQAARSSRPACQHGRCN